MRIVMLASLLAVAMASGVQAQDTSLPLEYLPPQRPAHAGSAPGLKAAELSPKTRSFRLVFSKGDDVVAGLTDFAEKNHLTNARFEAIGAFGSAVIGWSDRPKKTFKVVKINEEMEVASFLGNITRNSEGKPVVHAHCVVGLLRNGAVYAGHCVQEEVSITMQMYLTDAGEPTN